MRSFWRLTREMAGDKWVLLLALSFAFCSAGGLGAGILSFGPLLTMVLDREANHSLHSLAIDYNAKPHHAYIPQAIIDLLPTTPLSSVMLILSVIAVITLVGGAFNFLHQYLSQTVTARTIGRIRKQTYDAVVHQPLITVITRGPTDAVSRIIRDTAELQRGLIALLSKAVTQATKGVAALLVAVVSDWRLTVIAIPTLIVIAVILRKLGKRIRRGTRSSLQATHELLRHSTESLQALRAVKTAVAEDEVSSRFHDINQNVVHHELRVRTARALSAPVVESIATIVVLILTATVANQILNGTVKLEDFVLTFASLGLAGASFRPLTGLITDIQAAAAPAKRLEEIIHSVPEESPAANLPEIPRHIRS
ncbi:MAG TPA: ABC transporter transmembrane domain-containing protein, partial [Phycisphaerales bacterium]|nr:ABC transporter transmembrane domain-containing protein [Phycisphaerales bacterium]